ncbi:M15 family metallopeptidase [Paenibacillus harenae]|uniref:Peptidoglycan L-alanyl-D-glutamate endopeptidase CwlK n=1 Tax=Paenibacillus harenae TaxID=306543 RepID=A0ABT9U2U0_PAEHA|nr:M15 family metallopeptidase [Paenibacillus harenae]MDQ0113945.1 peptidoglycan L-alanyl-D-glutamate endopeptidase CwlK [Paenibacillus harenae]
MIERTSYTPGSLPQPPLPVNRKSSSRRRRNQVLIFIVAFLVAATAWKLFDRSGSELPFSPEINVPPVTELHPIVAAKQQELIAQTSEAGITILITDGFRSTEEQNGLYEQGRSTDGPVVTQVRGGHSYHNYGLAIDFALRTKDGEVVWDMKYDGNGNSKADWLEVVAIAKKLGFSWGGDWEGFKDYPHLQMDFGYSIRELLRGKRPPME